MHLWLYCNVSRKEELLPQLKLTYDLTRKFKYPLNCFVYIVTQPQGSIDDWIICSYKCIVVCSLIGVDQALYIQQHLVRQWFRKFKHFSLTCEPTVKGIFAKSWQFSGAVSSLMTCFIQFGHFIKDIIIKTTYW